VQPNRLREIVDLRYRFLAHESLTGNLGRSIRIAGARREDTRRTMMEFYRALPHEFMESYRALFLHLAGGELPLVFNCTVGKDRTGVAAALILALLGVPQSVIIEDYLLTEHCFEQSCAMFIGQFEGLLRGVPREVWEPLMRTDEAYLRATFDELEAAHGSVEGYARTELGLSTEAIDNIRNHLIDR